MHHFPIGSRIRYYPEYQKSVKLDSIILGYGINNFLVYSHQDIKQVKEKNRTVVYVKSPEASYPVKRFTEFYLLLPFMTRTTLEYPVGAATDGYKSKRPQERKVNDFRRGNSIVICTQTPSKKGLPHLDSTVLRVMKPTDGYYINRDLVILKPQLDTFECIDNRRFKRLITNIPCTFLLPQDRKEHACVIKDFTEKSIRIQLESDPGLIKRIQKGQNLVLQIGPAEQKDLLNISATTIKRRKDQVVISLVGLKKSKGFQPIDPIDELYIKATLLNRPETERGE